MKFAPSLLLSNYSHGSEIHRSSKFEITEFFTNREGVGG